MRSNGQRRRGKFQKFEFHTDTTSLSRRRMEASEVCTMSTETRVRGMRGEMKSIPVFHSIPAAAVAAIQWDRHQTDTARGGPSILLSFDVRHGVHTPRSIHPRQPFGETEILAHTVRYYTGGRPVCLCGYPTSTLQR